MAALAGKSLSQFLPVLLRWRFGNSLDEAVLQVGLTSNAVLVIISLPMFRCDFYRSCDVSPT